MARRCMEEAQAAGHTTAWVDLYQDHAKSGFDPILTQEEIQRRFSFDDTVLGYSREIRNADAYVFVHPDWWGMPPALLKGWLDRVLRPGIAYDYDGPEFLPKKRIPLLGDKRAMVLCTTDARKEDMGSTPESPHPIQALWRVSILGYCGIPDVRVEVFWNVHDSTLRERRRWIDRTGEMARTLFSTDGLSMNRRDI